MMKNEIGKTKQLCTLQNFIKGTYTKGQKIKVLIGCVWQYVTVEDYDPNTKYYLCGTNSWSTHFHESEMQIV